MATTSVTLSLSSADLTGDSLALSTSTNLNKAGTLTGLDQTTGVARKTFSTTSIQTLIAKGDFADDKAHKVYIKNTSTTATENLIITIESQLLGRLYAGDFMFFPFNGDQDIKVTPSVATDMTVEFLVIYEA
tara:strand:- start:2411 stop:2806 length:396 start_codon:yes stop_codon:yes gene_type:complete